MYQSNYSQCLSTWHDQAWTLRLSIHAAEPCCHHICSATFGFGSLLEITSCPRRLPRYATEVTVAGTAATPVAQHCDITLLDTSRKKHESNPMQDAKYAEAIGIIGMARAA